MGDNRVGLFYPVFINVIITNMSMYCLRFIVSLASKFTYYEEVNGLGSPICHGIYVVRFDGAESKSNRWQHQHTKERKKAESTI